MTEVVPVGQAVVRIALPADLPGAREVREQVFVHGQGVPPELDRDGRDEDAVRAVALVDGEVVGTGRLLAGDDVGVIGRMAVLPGHRAAGIGAQLLATLERAAVHSGLSRVELHAQLTARGFYDRAGYRACGEPYVEAGLEHVTMDKRLPTVRAVGDCDGAALIELITDCWSAYPGCVMDVDLEEPWLRAPATAYAAMDARGWVAEMDGRLAGFVGFRPYGGDVGELKSLYVAASARRQGLGSLLSGLVEDEARRRGVARLELWSDTRFADAHRLYARLGWTGLPDTRDLHDLSNTTEQHYAKELA